MVSSCVERRSDMTGDFSNMKCNGDFKGIVIWGWSRCRSVMGMMRELAGMVPVKFALWHDGVGDYRIEQGHRANEFDDMEAIVVGDDWDAAAGLFNATKGWVHLVSPYQKSPLARRIAVAAHERGDIVGIICEAPWNGKRYGAFKDMAKPMWWLRRFADGCRSVLWNMYLRTVLKWRIRKVVAVADFFVMYSGNDMHTACAAGWPESKLVGYGYFSPPLEGSAAIKRHQPSTSGHVFNVLATGTSGCEHRGAIVLKKAEALFRKQHPDVKVNFLMPEFVSAEDVRRLYQTCDVFIGAGENEPWGMRLNDALNCGSPLLVSDGMGGRKIVEQTGAGLVFRHKDEYDLADKLFELISNYGRYAEAAYMARERFSCKAGAEELLRIVRQHIGRG